MIDLIVFTLPEWKEFSEETAGSVLPDMTVLVGTDTQGDYVAVDRRIVLVIFLERLALKYRPKTKIGMELTVLAAQELSALHHNSSSLL